MRVIHHILPVVAILLITGCAKSQESKSEMQEGAKPSQGEATPASLDGKMFVVSSKELGKEATEVDTLVFTAGTFRSKACDQYGFTAGSYIVKGDAAMMMFNSTTTSSSEGRMEWSGSVTGDKIQGKVIWIKDGQASITYEFNGMVTM